MPRNARIVPVVLLLSCIGGPVGCRHDAPTAAAVAPEDQFGVALQGIRLSANGYVVDFRYRVLDADKALPLVDRTKKAFLLHQPSGMALAVPEAPTIGPLRQTEKFGKPQAGRTYVVLFANAGKLVQAGDRVTVVIGDFRVPDLVVQ
jgi:hypothetical protein